MLKICKISQNDVSKNVIVVMYNLIKRIIKIKGREWYGYSE